MSLTQFIVDAFAENPFSGNPAAVVPLEKWISDSLMQKIAAENNLSETAFFVRRGDEFDLRWFAPKGEVDLCGHATLAAAFVIFTELDWEKKDVIFETKSGSLNVRKQGTLLTMDFPSRPPKPADTPPALKEGLGVEIVETLTADDYIAVLKDEEAVKNLNPNLSALSSLDLRGVVATAKGKKCDFVSRVFAPKIGIPEDPVTGSTHCALAPYWAEKLNKKKFIARQLSSRGGEIHCEFKGARVTLAGTAVKVLKGKFFV